MPGSRSGNPKAGVRQDSRHKSKRSMLDRANGFDLDIAAPTRRAPARLEDHPTIDKCDHRCKWPIGTNADGDHRKMSHGPQTVVFQFHISPKNPPKGWRI